MRESRKRIIFVDDEVNVLDGIRRMLRRHFNPDEWEIAFSTSGDEALAMMAENPFDVIVSDMRMPGMNGVTLLGKVMEQYPQTIRFILSGHSEQQLIMQSIGSTHQYLSKPCDSDVLIGTIRRAFELRSVIENDALLQIVARIKSLPALPDLYVKVMHELKSADSSGERVGEIIASDVAMSAKVLQVVNSAFFGMRRNVESPKHAVQLLGLDIVKSLVLMLQVFSQSDVPRIHGFSMDSLWRHSLLVGRCSQAIMRKSEPDKKAADDCYMAGLMHDIGKLVLALNMSAKYADALALTSGTDIKLEDAERQVFEVTHGQVGGYLIGLWGFPDPVVEACIFHGVPSASSVNRFTSLAAVHVADCLCNRYRPFDNVSESKECDLAFLQRIGCESRLPAWESLCRQICEEGESAA